MVADPFAVLVGTTRRRAVHTDDKRTSLGIANNHATAVVYFGHTSQLTVDGGFPILPKTTTFFNVGFGDRPDLEFWLISDTADTDVRLMEFFEDEVE